RLSSPPRTDVGPDGPLSDSGERHLDGKIVVHRPDSGGPDNGGEREGRLQRREVFTDTRTWPAGERDELPAPAVLGFFRAEPVGVEDPRALPERRIAMQGSNPDGHKGARLDPVAVDREVVPRQPTDARGRRLQPQRFVQHLHGVFEAGPGGWFY